MVKKNLDTIYKYLLIKCESLIKGIVLIRSLTTLNANNENTINLLNINQTNKNLKYFFKYNKFITKSFTVQNNYKLPNNLLIVKHYRINYERHQVPKMGIKKLKNATALTATNTFDLLAAYLVNTIIKDSDLFQKK